MSLSFSHAVLYARDEGVMLDFYTKILGFEVTDRGPLGPDGPEVIFMSQDPLEHHQVALAVARQDEGPSNTVNHLAFRVPEFEDIGELERKLQPLEGINIAPLCHGNALSIYFNDPEGNGLEVFWDTPWHVAQPMVRPWDSSLDKQQALAWLEGEFRDDAGFCPVEEYRQQRLAELAAR